MVSKVDRKHKWNHPIKMRNRETTKGIALAFKRACSVHPSQNLKPAKQGERQCLACGHGPSMVVWANHSGPEKAEHAGCFHDFPEHLTVWLKRLLTTFRQQDHVA